MARSINRGLFSSLRPSRKKGQVSVVTRVEVIDATIVRQQASCVIVLLLLAIDLAVTLKTTRSDQGGEYLQSCDHETSGRGQLVDPT